MVVAQNRTNKTIEEGLAEFQKNLEVGVGRIEIALLPSNIVLKNSFREDLAEWQVKLVLNC